MSAPGCEVCDRRLTGEYDGGMRCACRQCGGRHRYCLACAILFGDVLRPMRGDVWAEVDLCPADARATAELSGFPIGPTAWDRYRETKESLGIRDRTFPDRQPGADLRSTLT